MRIGIDIQDTKRMKSLPGTSKMERIFSPKEREYIAHIGAATEFKKHL